MRLGLRVLMMALVLLASVNAGAVELDKTFKLLCIGDQATGFDWENHNWVAKRFPSSKYIITKMPVDKQITPFCASKTEQDPFPGLITDENITRYGCYDIHLSNNPDYPALSELCVEEWNKTNNKWILDTVSCSDQQNIEFKPDGAFIYIDPHVLHDLDDDTDNKDSKTITVGRCAVVQ